MTNEDRLSAHLPGGDMLDYVRRNTGEHQTLARDQFDAEAIEEARAAILEGRPLRGTSWYIHPLSRPADASYAVLQIHESGDLVSLVWIVWDQRISNAIWVSLDSMPRVPGVALRQPECIPWMAEIVASTEETMTPDRVAWTTEKVGAIAELAAWAVLPTDAG